MATWRLECAPQHNVLCLGDGVGQGFTFSKGGTAPCVRVTLTSVMHHARHMLVKAAVAVSEGMTKTTAHTSITRENTCCSVVMTPERTMPIMACTISRTAAVWKIFSSSYARLLSPVTHRSPRPTGDQSGTRSSVFSSVQRPMLPTTR